MKLGIMQPYFFPYIGYYSLIKHTDEFVIFDVVQYIRHGWIDRNRILSANSWQYINVPLIKPNGNRSIISEIGINYLIPWQEKILNKLQYYKNIAPYFDVVFPVVQSIISKKYSTVSDLNIASLKTICNYLGFDRRFLLMSEMNLQMEPINCPDEWALNICKALGAEYYLNPIGGLDFFDRAKYTNAGIDIGFLQMLNSEYEQRTSRPFEPWLSIIDVLMYNSIDKINTMLDSFTII